MKRPLMTTIRVWLAAATISAPMVMAQPAIGAPTVKGDAAAWGEIVAALEKQQTVSYRAKSMIGGGITEFVPPNSTHAIIPGLLEAIWVGDAYRVRAGEKWECTPAPTGGAPGLIPPIWKQPGEVTVARSQNLVIDGMPTRGYDFTRTGTSKGRTITMKYKLFVAVQTGLPRRLEVSGGARETFDFYDYGAKITITPPPCS